RRHPGRIAGGTEVVLRQVLGGVLGAGPGLALDAAIRVDRMLDRDVGEGQGTTRIESGSILTGQRARKRGQRHQADAADQEARSRGRSEGPEGKPMRPSRVRHRTFLSPGDPGQAAGEIGPVQRYHDDLINKTVKIFVPPRRVAVRSSRSGSWPSSLERRALRARGVA